MSKLLPTACKTIKELVDQLQEDVENIQDENKTILDLLGPNGMNKKELTPKETKFLNSVFKPLPLSGKNPFPKRQSESSDEKSKPKQYSLNDVINKVDNNLLSFSKSLNDFIEIRENTDKRTDVAKQKLLLGIDKKCEEGLDLFQVFEPDLGESLYKSLCVLEKKPEVSKYSLRKKLENESSEIDIIDIHFDEAQQKIIDAMNQDLASIDFDELRSDEGIKSLVDLNKSVSALKDIKTLKSDIIFRKEPWQNVEDSESPI